LQDNFIEVKLLILSGRDRKETLVI